MLPVLFLTLDDEDDRQFIANLYEDYYSIMKKRALQFVHDSNIVDDLINDSFVRLIDKIEILKDLDKYKTVAYIINTLKNTAINYINKLNKEKELMYFSDNDSLLESSPEIAYSIEEDYENKETYESLWATISELSKRDKYLLFYKYNLELHDKEIAKLMNIPTNNIREYLVRAKCRALKIITKKGLK